MELLWLLSTTATASAALVAIVGGLLVSRVVSLASERSGLLHRRDDLQAQLEQARQLSERLEERLLAWDADEVIRDHYEDLAKLVEEPDIEGMIRPSRVPRTPDEIRPYVDEVLAKMRTARSALEPLFEEGVSRRATLDDFVDAGGVVVPAGDEGLWEIVFSQLLEEYRPPPDSWSSISIPTTVFSGHSLAEQQEHAQLGRDAERARHEADALGIQLDQVQLALSRVSHPAGVGWGATVLGYFAAVGTMLPLVLMATGFHRWWVPRLVVTLFGSGVLALLAYVIGSVKAMSSGES